MYLSKLKNPQILSLSSHAMWGEQKPSHVSVKFFLDFSNCRGEEGADICGGFLCLLM